MTLKPQLFIIRGLPGSGKSTLARKLSEAMDAPYYEADMFMLDPNSGEYQFDRSKLPYAHECCQEAVNSIMARGESSVIASNTFTTRAEMAPYLAEAHKRGYPVVFIHCTGEYGSVHNVPQETIDRMLARWEHI